MSRIKVKENITMISNVGLNNVAFQGLTYKVGRDGEERRVGGNAFVYAKYRDNEYELYDSELSSHPRAKGLSVIENTDKPIRILKVDSGTRLYVQIRDEILNIDEVANGIVTTDSVVKVDKVGSRATKTSRIEKDQSVLLEKGDELRVDVNS